MSELPFDLEGLTKTESGGKKGETVLLRHCFEHQQKGKYAYIEALNEKEEVLAAFFYFRPLKIETVAGLASAIAQMCVDQMKGIRPLEGKGS